MSHATDAAFQGRQAPEGPEGDGPADHPWEGLGAEDSPFALASGRDVAALHDPRPACIVGAAGAGGRIGFATVIWATPISHTPPLVAFALRERSHTMGLLRASGRFSLCTLPADGEAARLVELCGSTSGHQEDKGAQVPHRLVEGVPVPICALSWEACRVESIQEAGDHLLVIGCVEAAATRCGQRDERGRLLPFETLLCVQHGAYGACSPLQPDARKAQSA